MHAQDTPPIDLAAHSLGAWMAPDDSQIVDVSYNSFGAPIAIEIEYADGSRGTVSFNVVHCQNPSVRERDDNWPEGRAHEW